MADLRFFDANVTVGRPQSETLYDPLGTPEALRRYTQGCALQGALVWHWAQMQGHPESANPLLESYRAAAPGVEVCWAVLPAATQEQPRLLERLVENRVAAVRLFPEAHRYLMNRVVWGDLLSALADRKVPVVLSLEHGVSWDQVYRLLADYPSLTCVLCDIGTWSMDRYTYPLLAAYPNVYVETSMLSLEDGGTEAAIRRVGAQRLVFGTGMPRRYAEATMLQLTHADLDLQDKQAIAAGNILRLMKGEVR